jgi:outer membrane protein insertion porin family
VKETYCAGNIKFYKAYRLFRSLLKQSGGVKKGEMEFFFKKIADQSKPDGEDITNLYQNNGYLFSNINAVEVKTVNDTIDFEIRVNEGPLAYFNKKQVVGNDKTNDRVIIEN